MFDFSLLVPLIIIVISLTLQMLVISFYRNHKLIAFISLFGLLLALISLFLISEDLPSWIGKLILDDHLSIFYLKITLIASILINIISFNYLSIFDEQKEEYYVLFNVAVLGSSIMITSQHFASFFIGLELLSIPLYVMVAFLRNNSQSIEAAVKYLIMAAASSAILLFGMALIYATTGSMFIKEISEYVMSVGHLPIICLVGYAMIIGAIGFKLALAPFHMWTPDIYQGAPSPVAAFLASVAKVGAFVFALKLFAFLTIESSQSILILLSVISAISMFTGNLLAIRQSSVKRILACSSIAHMGYILIALIVGGKGGAQAATFYLTGYILTTLGAFAVISLLSSDGKEKDHVDDFKGLYFKNKWLAIVLATMFFSLAGLPLTAGFMTKFYLIAIGLNNASWLLIWLLIINSAIGLYYYLRIVFIMFKPIESENNKIALPVLGSLVLAIILVAVIWIGLTPEFVLKSISDVMKK
jgi:NADH-quinone oxidoreductase subunit N